MSELAARLVDGVGLLLRRWWFVLGCGLLAAALGFLWSETINGDSGEATVRVGFGPDPAYYDILPNVDRVTAFVAGDAFRSELGLRSGSGGPVVEPDPPNGILAFIDLDVRGAESDAEAVEVANRAAALVVDHMNSLANQGSVESRDKLMAQLADIETQLPDLEAERDRLAEVQAELIVLRLEDEAAFERYEDASAARDKIRSEIDGLLRQRTEARLDLADLDRRRPDGEFEVLRTANVEESSSDQPVWPLAGAVGLALGSLVVVARDRDLLPVRESADLTSLRLNEDTLLVDGSVRSVALLLRRKADLGDRVLLAGFGMPTAAIVQRVEGLLGTLETSARVVGVDDSTAGGDAVLLIDGGEVGSSLAEHAVHADAAVLVVAAGEVQADDLSGPIAELSALGVPLHAVLVAEPAAGM